MTRIIVIRALVLALAAAGLAAAPGVAAAAEAVCHVRYLSAEHVYLDAGTGAGLAVGLRVQVERGGKPVAELEVVFTAENSASCQVVSKVAEIVTGDRVVYEPPATGAAAADTTSAEPSRTRATVKKKLGRGSGRRLALRGWTALSWDHTQESADRKLTTDLLQVPFRLKATGIGADVGFQARGTLRRIERGGFSGSTPATEWRNRILEASLVREGRGHAWQFALGRVGSRRTATAGPFDGLELTRRLGDDLHVSVFGGFAPDWGDLGFNTEDHLGGAVVNLRRAGEGGRYLDLTVAAIGRYRQGEISREYLTLVTTWRDGGRLSLLQAAEVDLNRGWRRDAAGRSLSLSSGALSGRYRLGDRISLDLGYDDREPVRTWETRSLPDSLFTDAGRNGWRGGLSFRGRSGLGLNLSGGLRRAENSDDEVRSWNAMLRLPARLLGVADLTLHARGFEGPLLSGFSPSFRLSRTTRSRLRLGLEAGRFAYSGSGGLVTRTNTWAELGCGRELAGDWEIYGSFRNDWGDDISGQRWFLELTRRF